MAVGARVMARGLAVREDRRRVGVLYHPRVGPSQPLARRLVEALAEHGAEPQLFSAWEEKGGLGERLAGLGWLVVMGGDGTLVRVGRIAAEQGLPLIGVNFGRLGFLAELSPEEAVLRLPALLDGSGTVEDRLMLRAEAAQSGRSIGPLDAVNDVFVGRGRVARAVRLAVAVDGVPVIRFTADGLIVSTPTGSTAYALSAGGPVVPPELDVLVLTPVVPHPVPVRTLVLPPAATVEVTVQTDEGAILSVDGQIHHDLLDGDTVQVAAGPNRLRLLRYGPADQFYRSLAERLGKW
jgi:NAD+ kinase